jgi:phosphatidylserine/phosphatidylglycerophosphate/cardiolipin synthase-like enzyme
MNSFQSKNGVSVRAYKGDAMTLLAFNVTAARKKDLAGFSIQYRFKDAGVWQEPYMYNRLKFPDSFFVNNPGIPVMDRNSTLYSPIQKFNWVHVPNTNINTNLPVFGDYTYNITPRYIKNGILLPLDNTLTVSVTINVSPFYMKKTKLGFTRGFVSSVAYAKRFDVNNNKVRPAKANDDLLFDITQKAGTAKRWNDTTKKYVPTDYSFEEQHKWLGWQTRERIMEFLDEAINDNSISVKAFLYDINEPEISKRLLQLASENRLKVIGDDAGSHGDADSMETSFETRFKQRAADNMAIHRGHYSALAHSKVFIHIKNNRAIKVLTGSTNFSTNGLYINSNHVLIFEDKKIAQLYADVFDASFGVANMKSFKGSLLSTTDHSFSAAGLPKMTVSFAPHPKADAERIFERINKRILKAGNTDVLFAIMKDTNQSSILDAIQEQVRSENVFTYGITDSIGDNAEYSVFLYKPNAKRGIRVAAKGISNTLPKPFGKVAGIDGYAIHHKFVVVNFKGADPVVYCGSSNLSFGPEQKNGDNLLEIHDKDIVTAFAIEALRLVDHFHWRNNELKETDEMHLDDLSGSSYTWYNAWFATNDLKCRQRKLYIKA